MGGNGTFATGNQVEYRFETVGTLHGVKILRGINGRNGFPVESHNSSAYIQLHPDRTFKMIRFYDKNHYLVKEIAYHPEPKLDPSRKPVLHVHEYVPGHLEDQERHPRLPTIEEMIQYSKFLIGVK